MISKLEHRLIKIAYEYAEDLEHTHQHVSFFCKRNAILSVGVNRPYTTHPISKRFGHRYDSIHSELDAFMSFKHRYHDPDWGSIILFNVKTGPNKMIKLAEPCDCCKNWLRTVGVKNIKYTTHEGEFQNLRL